jgi:hypothetical protein
MSLDRELEVGELLGLERATHDLQRLLGLGRELRRVGLEGDEERGGGRRRGSGGGPSRFTLIERVTGGGVSMSTSADSLTSFSLMTLLSWAVEAKGARAQRTAATIDLVLMGPPEGNGWVR